MEKRKLILKNSQSPGDIVMLTAAVRDLHKCCPGQFLTDVRTPCDGLWENNPYLTPLDEEADGVEVIACGYPLIHQSNQGPWHFIHGFTRFLGGHLKVNLQPTLFKGDIHLSMQDKSGISQVAEITGEETPFWIIVAGGKRDFTIKWWEPARWQRVVDHFQGKIQFVQVGEKDHHHPALEGVVDLRGKTDLRQFVRLMYHAQGVVCPVTFAMHLAAAVETKADRSKNRPCVVVAGGREPAQWEAYPHHQFISNNGALACCDNGGCWKSRTVPLRDGDAKDRNCCVDVVGTLPRCMDMISAEEVVRRIETYFQGGVCRYLERGKMVGTSRCDVPARVQRAERTTASFPTAPLDAARTAQRAIPTVTLAFAPDENDPLTPATVQQRMDEFISNIPAYPGGHAGRGIVICGGGQKYFPCAWVCIQMLRRLGCQLPVQIWHLGAEEMDEAMKKLVAPLGVTAVDARELQQKHPARTLNGWELKSYALRHAPFQELLLLDADNVPVVNPEFLFETPEFKETGAIFWPDYGNLKPKPLIWNWCGISYRNERDFESGQIVVNKETCWRELCLSLWMNEHSDFFYEHMHGDKDTFHLAWRKLRRDYAMPARAIHPLLHTMCQHDFQGRRIFQHRNLAKWKLFGENPCIEGFLHEEECLEYLERLRAVWNPSFDLNAKTEREREAARALLQAGFEYRRVGFDQRPMRFEANGTIGEGAAACERFWAVKQENGHVVLEILSEKELTCRLIKSEQGIWRGRWQQYEQMPVELVPQHEAGHS